MKKVLSLVLVLTLVLGSFSMAFAAETTETNLSDVAGNANEGAIEVANDLGIIDGYPDGTFKPDNAVTRAEFAKMMTKALAIPESALKGFKTSSFKDVASDHWAVAYLGYCNSKGIMTGYEDGTARPNQTITVNEAITMICRALGYTNQAKELVGSWPANYIALGQQLKLYKDVAAVATTDRASAAQIVYNALTCNLRYIDADGKTCDVEDKNGLAVKMLNNLGGKQAANGKAFVLMYADADKAVINCREYVGSLVTAFVNDDDEIIALSEESTTITGYQDGDKFVTDDVEYVLKAATDISKVSFDGIFDIDGTPDSGNPYYIQNGEDNNRFNPAGGNYDTTGNTDYTMAVKISGKTIEQVYSIIDWTRAKYSQFKASDLKIDKATITVGGQVFDFPTDKSENIDMSKFVLLGVTSLEKIAKDNVIEVYVDPGTTDIRKLEVGTKTVEGTCTKINRDGDTFTIDGTAYGYDGKAGDQPKVGDKGTAYLGYDGDIVFWDKTDAASGNYAVVTKVWAEMKRGTNTTFAAILDKEGKSHDIEFKDGTTGDNLNLSTVTGLADGRIITYSLDSSGKFSKFNIIGSGANTGNVNGSGDIYDGNAFISTTVVFLKDGDDWKVGSTKNFKAGDTGVAVKDQYIDDGEILAISADKANVIGDDKEFGVITGVDLRDDDGTPTWYVTGIRNGEAFEGFIKDETNPANTTYTKSAKCDEGLYQITVDTDGYVTIDVTASVSNKLATKAAFTSNIATDVTERSNGMYTVKVSGAGIMDVAKDASVYVWSKKDKKFTKGTVAGVQDMFVELYHTTKASLPTEDNYVTVILAWDAE